MKPLAQRLPHLPVTAFAMVMGLTGLAIAFGKFYHLQWLPKAPFDVTLFLGLGVFVLLSVLFLTKERKAFQIKGSIELQDSGPIFDEMKRINPENYPGHSAAVLRVQNIFSGSEQII
jgi:hypothetical protein